MFANKTILMIKHDQTVDYFIFSVRKRECFMSTDHINTYCNRQKKFSLFTKTSNVNICLCVEAVFTPIINEYLLLETLNVKNRFTVFGLKLKPFNWTY